MGQNRVPLPLLIALVAMMPSPAAAESANNNTESTVVCASYEKLKHYLAAKFDEHPVFTGPMNEQLTLQIFLNRKSGSWSALVVRANGVSCVHGVGEYGRYEIGF